MKVHVTIFAVVIVSALLIAGCSNNGANPTGYVNGYTVHLTDSAGTTYTGDFFPLYEGYTCYYSGDENVQYTATVTGEPAEVDSVVGPTDGMLGVLDTQLVTLPSGAFWLYPIVENSGLGEYDTSVYYLKDAQAVYVKAMRASDGSFTEMKNPVFIKSKLVVGDSWESSPQMDMAQLLEGESGISASESSLQYNSSAKFFVAGHEFVDLPAIGTRNTVRLEQANQTSISGTIVSQGTSVTLNITGQFAVVYNLIADTGIAKQNLTGTMSMTASAQGETVKINIDINESSIALTSISTNSAISPAVTIRAHRQPVFKKPVQDKLWNVSQKIARAYFNQLGVPVQR
ncbi:MAG: hypothetical protein ACLP05_00500 [Candidatus Kryptoniota bacterium]